MKISQFFVNPVVSMELRLRMRSKRTPWVIFFYLLALGAIIFAFVYTVTQSGGYFNPSNSKTLFMIISFIQFALISLVTPGLTAGVISGEREKQTLNILLTTNLSAIKIILGKWLSSLSFMLFLIIASLPLYSIVFLYGGISPSQLVQVFGFYFIGMLAIGSFGVMFSTMTKRTGVATVITYVTIIAYTVITLIIPEVAKGVYNAQRVAPGKWIEWMYSINPVMSMINIFEKYQMRNLPIPPYWIFIIFFAGLTIIALAFSIYFIKPVRKKISLSNL